MKNDKQESADKIVGSTDGLADSDCLSCGEGEPNGECQNSKRQCGHHCNHSWTHDMCCWCSKEYGEAANV